MPSSCSIAREDTACGGLPFAEPGVASRGRGGDRGRRNRECVWLSRAVVQECKRVCASQETTQAKESAALASSARENLQKFASSLATGAGPLLRRLVDVLATSFGSEGKRVHGDTSGSTAPPPSPPPSTSTTSLCARLLLARQLSTTRALAPFISASSLSSPALSDDAESSALNRS